MNIEELIRSSIKNRQAVKLRNSQKAFVLLDERDFGFTFENSNYPFVGLIDNAKGWWSETGKYALPFISNNLDIIGLWEESHPLESMPVNHPIYVRCNGNWSWAKSHYSHIVKNADQIRVATFYDGKTSFSDIGERVSEWHEYRLPTSAELKGSAWENSPFISAPPPNKASGKDATQDAQDARNAVFGAPQWYIDAI